MSDTAANTAPLMAHDAWAQLGWPSPRLEAWRYFPLRAFEGRDPGASQAPAAMPVATSDADSSAWTIINGRVHTELSPAIQAGGLVSVHAHGDVTPGAVGPTGAWADGLEAANAAFGHETIVVEVPQNAKIKEPIRIVVMSLGAGFSHPRLALRLGAGAEATVIVEYRSEGEVFTNVVTSVVLGADATLQHAIIIADDTRACHVEHIDAQLGRGASWRAFTATARGGAARTAAHVHLLGEAAEAVVDGIYMPTGQSRFDHFIDFDHAAARTISHATWAGAIDQRATGTFLGRVRIGAQIKDCKSRQLTRSLLLSPTATANAKPELHIDCDEVEASHGATIGQLDPRQLFYLISRGLEPVVARDMLIHAFIRDAIARAPEGAQPIIAAALGLDHDANETEFAGDLGDA